MWQIINQSYHQQLEIEDFDIFQSSCFEISMVYDFFLLFIVVPVTTDLTQDVRLVSIKNCIFRGNRANEFGSAISHNIASALEKISNISNFLIENW